MAALPLAFVDVETTGLGPSQHRVTEIGVVTVDGATVERWGTLLRTPCERAPLDSAIDRQVTDARVDAPRFADIAPDLARRLAGRLFVAHNARFDHAFLRAEFARVGIAFEPQVVCSVMLSRALYPELTHHNLDALASAHRLRVEERHRALPDAELLWQWWQALQRDHPRRSITRAITRLQAGPMLPPALDPALLERLPPRPGAYVLHGRGGTPLVVGAAGNLRLHVTDYFRLDHASTRALEHAPRVADITWRTTSGIIGARLEAATLDAAHFPQVERRLAQPLHTWRLLPDAVPCVELASLASLDDDHATYGLFATERKARNALCRLAETHRLSAPLLGLEPFAPCAGERGGVAHKKDLLRIFDALRTLKVAAWPHEGPVGLRERTDVHVVDRWRYLGTARSEHELSALLDARLPDFNARMFRLLRRTLANVPPRNIVKLAARARSSAIA